MLIDTQVLVWHGMRSKLLSAVATRAIQGGGHHYSHATVWELSIKSALQKISLEVQGQRATASEFVISVASRLQLTALPLEFEDLAGVEALPLHHKDPFDRLMVVQARRRRLGIVSSDPVFDKYGLTRVW